MFYPVSIITHFITKSFINITMGHPCTHCEPDLLFLREWAMFLKVAGSARAQAKPGGIGKLLDILKKSMKYANSLTLRYAV